MITEPNQRLVKITTLVQEHLQDSFRRRSKADRIHLKRYLSGPDYRWQHTLRVAQFGRVIAENESAEVEIVVAACLLHDLAWFDTKAETSREHGRVGAEKARPLVASLGYPTEEIEKICYAVASHVDVDNPTTLEAKILSDADNIDRFGPFRILQWCFPDIEDYDKLAVKLGERIQRLEHYRKESPLFTSTGRQLFSEQLELQIKFFSQFVGEKALTVMPQV
jgi:5'-deoxynucleotidase YfbR-like HD superfamily hydrolase